MAEEHLLLTLPCVSAITVKRVKSASSALTRFNQQLHNSYLESNKRKPDCDFAYTCLNALWNEPRNVLESKRVQESKRVSKSQYASYSHVKPSQVICHVYVQVTCHVYVLGIQTRPKP